jgi:hypothetical protein
VERELDNRPPVKENVEKRKQEASSQNNAFLIFAFGIRENFNE